MPDRELQARVAVLECAFIELYAELRRTGVLDSRQARSIQLSIKNKARRAPESAYAWQLVDKLAAEPRVMAGAGPSGLTPSPAGA
jgi:hypothetical protein